jgi:hypothetical protein
VCVCVCVCVCARERRKITKKKKTERIALRHRDLHARILLAKSEVINIQVLGRSVFVIALP